MSASKSRMRRAIAPARPVLVTGFEPFGGYTLNPSAEIARRLDRMHIAGVPVVGRVLPVVLDGLDGRLRDLVAKLRPSAIVALGLAGGETVIRLERQAVNRAAFEIPDNAGRQPADQPLDPAGPASRASRLPLAAIQGALLRRGIPARLSDSAGTYVCNAAMYALLGAAPETTPCGFIHLPHMRAEVARRIEAAIDSLVDPAKFASMEFPTLRRAVELAIEQVVLCGRSNQRPTAPPRA
jgi:pyroglutamyl-peptidase